MALPYNTLTANNTGDFFEIFQFINNDITGGMFFPLILAGIWFIVFIVGVINGRDASRSWIASSFMCSVLGIVLGLLGFLNKTYVYFLILLTAFGLLWRRFETASN